MSLLSYYSEQIKKYQKALDQIQKKEDRLSLSRLLTFALALVLFYVTLGISLGVAILLLTVGLILFTYVIKQHVNTIQQRIHLQNLLIINKKELACINGNFQNYPDGHEHIDKEHPFTSDLDIFGKSSLFQYLNRTTSNPGYNLLAKWLKSPSEVEKINERQEAVTELKDMSTWRQELMAIGYKYADSHNDPEILIEWILEKPHFLNNNFLKIAINILSLLSIFSIIVLPFGMPVSIISLLITINISVFYKKLKDISTIHKRVTKTAELLKSYEEAILLIENQIFKSSRLNELQKRFILSDTSASKEIRELSTLVHKLDYRLNLLISLPANLLYFWDIRQVLKLEKWKTQNRAHLHQWFSAMAEFEAISSLANLYFNNPEWVMPSVSLDHFRLSSIEMGHPLIPKIRRVCNNFNVDGIGKIVIVTGSNMSGKSTFLRTCGANIVLAMAGAPVCAKKFEISRVNILTSMRITDSLEENTSSFYAELKRLAIIIKTVENKENVFLLLDEILRGTNSNDRHIGSVALIRQLIRSEAIGIIATHDLALSNLATELPQQIDNYNFDVKVEDDELFFDYKLSKGICKSLNASILMRKMGIKVQ